MPLPRLLPCNLDVYNTTLAFHSATDLLALLSTNHTLHTSLAHTRTRTTLLSALCPLLPPQQRTLVWSGAEDVRALLAVLSCVEQRLLKGRTITPLHLALLVQSLVGTASSSHAASATSPSTFATSARSMLSAALSSSSPFLPRFFSPTPTVTTTTPAATTTTTAVLSACPTLHSLHQPHLSLWLHNPFHSAGFLSEWHNQRKPNSPPNIDTSHLASLRDTLDSRIVWLGSWRDDRHSLSCFGLYFGTLDTARDGQHRYDLRQLPLTPAPHCQQRMCDTATQWAQLPVVSIDLAWSSDATVGGATATAMPPLLYFPSLTAFLLSVSSFAATVDIGSDIRRLLCGQTTAASAAAAAAASEAECEECVDVLEGVECCGKSWRWWAGCLIGECGRHMLPSFTTL